MSKCSSNRTRGVFSFSLSSVHRQINNIAPTTTTTSSAMNCKDNNASSFNATSKTVSCSNCSSSWHHRARQLKKSVLRNKKLHCSCNSLSILPTVFSNMSCSSAKSVLTFDIYYCCYLLRNSFSIFIYEIRQNKRGKQ